MTHPLHIPVLQETVLQVLSPASGERVLDCTLGLGGHSAAFLEASAPGGTLTALDADTQNLVIARERLRSFGDRAQLIHANFRDVAALQLGTFDVVFADLGLSSPHVDDPDRGFSFRTDGPLDLRYDRMSGRTASDLIAASTEDDLVSLIHDLGEVHQYVRPLARLIAGTRIDTTFQFRAKVEEIFTYRTPGILPRLFQALRIAVNDELGALGALLGAIPTLLHAGGRAGILSYHSLEDRMVKHALKALCEPTKDLLTGRVTDDALCVLRTKKAIIPDARELAENPRSRSVKFRALQRI